MLPFPIGPIVFMLGTNVQGWAIGRRANACQAVDSCGQIETSGESSKGYIEDVPFTKAALHEACSEDWHGLLAPFGAPTPSTWGRELRIVFYMVI